MFSYCKQFFLLMTNDFWGFSVYCLIYLLFESNTLAWKTWWKHLGVLGDCPGEVSIQSFHYFYKKLLNTAFLAWISVFILLLNHAGSLSLHTIVYEE